jgi:ribosomal subunit interface protein
MEILVHAEAFTMTETLKAAVEDKIGRLEHLFPRALRARVTLKRVSAHPSPKQFLARALFEVPGDDLSAEEHGEDPLVTVDLLSEKVESQLRKRKTEYLARRTRAVEVRP